MKKKQSKTPNASHCPSVASGGVLRCALERGHKGHHSTYAGKGKPTEHATWSEPDGQGKVQVTAFRKGRQKISWVEDPPQILVGDRPAAPVEIVERHDHDGDGNCHIHPSPGTPRTPRPRPHSCHAADKILGYRRHPVAALFPMLEGNDLEVLADSIAANGLRDPIVLVHVDGEDWILDGSNRALACQMRGVKPRFVRYEGPTDIDSLVRYSLDKNGDGRRHLTPSQRAMIAAEGALLTRGRPSSEKTGSTSGLTQAERAKLLHVSERLVRKAVAVRDRGTDTVKQAVKAGKLTVEAAEVVTKLPPKKQDEIARQALERKTEIKSGRVRALVKQEEKRAVVRKINEQRVEPMPAGLFGVIYADYPWPYDNSDQHDGSRGHLTYPPMKMDDILAHAREAAKRAAKDAIVALWTTNLHLANGNAARLVEAYGATPHTIVTWPKPRAGVGTWPRGQTEHLVIASIGEPVHTLNEITTLLPSWQPERPREHSSKPKEVAELLVKHCAGPFLELFARAERDGWECWGAEVEKFSKEASVLPRAEVRR